MASESHTTTDHDEIRKWVESNKGKPAGVKDTGGGDDPGILRIDFPWRRRRGQPGAHQLGGVVRQVRREQACIPISVRKSQRGSEHIL